MEDDKDLIKCWSRLFTLKGYEHRLYKTASEALDDLEGLKKCDLFITDYYLPDSNGIELARKLRGELSVPFVLLTGSREEALVFEVEKVENFSILYKPLRFKALEAEIQKILDASNK